MHRLSTPEATLDERRTETWHQLLVRLQPQGPAIGVGTHLDHAAVVHVAHDAEERLRAQQRHWSTRGSGELRQVRATRVYRRGAAAYGVVYLAFYSARDVQTLTNQRGAQRLEMVH